MVAVKDTSEIEEAKGFIREGDEFDFHVTDSMIKFNKVNHLIKQESHAADGSLLDIQDRVAFAQLIPEIGQLLAYSVLRRYQIYLINGNNEFVLRFKLPNNNK